MLGIADEVVKHCHTVRREPEVREAINGGLARDDEAIYQIQDSSLMERETRRIHGGLGKASTAAQPDSRKRVSLVAASADVAVAVSDSDRADETVVVQMHDYSRARLSRCPKGSRAEEGRDVVHMDDLCAGALDRVLDLSGMQPARQHRRTGTSSAADALERLAGALEQLDAVSAGTKQRRHLGNRTLLATWFAVAVVKQKHRRLSHFALLSVLHPMSVALVTNYLPPYRLPLYELLAERLGVELFCFGGEGRYVPEALRDLELQIASAPFPAHRLARQRDAARLAKRHEAVIASIAGRVALPAAFRGARKRGRPFLLWASLWRHPRTPAHLFSRPLMRRIYKRADAILTYGPHVSRYVSHYRHSDESVFVAPQAVEQDLFARPVAEEEIAGWRDVLKLPEGPLVLFVGRMVPEKGTKTLLKAWRRVFKRAEGALCVVGSGPHRTERAFFDEPGVRLTGRVPRESLPVAYAAADVVVVPSIATRRFVEPWGLVCNEAMSQGCPVIATSAVGAAAGGLVQDGETGLVVPPGDARKLADAIDRLLDDEGLRERLGRQAKATVAGYSYERAADAFARALEIAVKSPALRA